MLPLRLLSFIAALVSFSAFAAPAIRLNTLGFLPDAPKQATVAAKSGDFSVVRAHDGATVFNGTLQPLASAPDGEEVLAAADFSGLRAPGTYVLQVKNAGESPAFRITSDLYREPFFLVTRAMYLWRCGVEVSGEWQGRHFHHAACHLDDAWLDHVTGRHEKLASTGGWHDAGDYNKYVVNAGVTLGAMLRAWED
ncbi:MAG TPA: glycoside hydrolase family 9 protein, partial [Opitutus sp.]|nr:glycoside hydrolase family 9 protein [Opitutus sp.]